MWGIFPSEWLHWFGGLDWSHLDNVVSSIVGVLGLTGIAWATVRFVLNPLASRLGRRRAQAKLLDQLACGSSVAFVESLFGPAQFITLRGDYEYRTYHLHGAWVMIDVKGNEVMSFSITITKRRMYYSTKRHSFGFLKLNLGKDTFGDHGIGYDGERLWIGAYRNGYLRTYYFMRSGAYQNYFISYNMSGIGQMAIDTQQHSANSVKFAQDNPAEAIPSEPGLEAKGITANTLTLVHPEMPLDQYISSNILGPDEAHVQRATAIKPPNNQPVRGRIRYRWYLLKQGAKKLFGG